ncbi:hypothetical protein PR048_007039 [Dryococelus australis]|uniref:Uncharacterized protein n=1 Tax=Dryococelus australis TaxID=614101 RepID=A0ABQ9ICJ8_9NEOP|nr:hypothetical protein PR048_007039 [Dryococelus australis]
MQEERSVIPLEMIPHLVDSLPRRVTAVIEAKDGATPPYKSVTHRNEHQALSLARQTTFLSCAIVLIQEGGQVDRRWLVVSDGMYDCHVAEELGERVDDRRDGLLVRLRRRLPDHVIHDVSCEIHVVDLLSHDGNAPILQVSIPLFSPTSQKVGNYYKEICALVERWALTHDGECIFLKYPFSTSSSFCYLRHISLHFTYFQADLKKDRPVQAAFCAENACGFSFIGGLWPHRTTLSSGIRPRRMYRITGEAMARVEVKSAGGEQGMKTERTRANRLRLERVSQNKSSDTHKTPYDRVKRCRKSKINTKASKRVNVDVFTQNKRPLLVSLPAEPGSIPDAVAPVFSHVRIMPDDAADRRVFLSGLPFPPAPAFRPALLHASPSSALQDLDISLLHSHSLCNAGITYPRTARHRKQGTTLKTKRPMKYKIDLTRYLVLLPDVVQHAGQCAHGHVTPGVGAPVAGGRSPGHSPAGVGRRVGRVVVHVRQGFRKVERNSAGTILPKSHCSSLGWAELSSSVETPDSPCTMSLACLPTQPSLPRKLPDSAHESGALSVWCNHPYLVRLSLHEAEEYPGSRTLAGLRKRPKIP